MKRIALAGFLCALAMFVWMSIAHMLLPLDETGIQFNPSPTRTRSSPT